VASCCSQLALFKSAASSRMQYGSSSGEIFRARV
jgi:hypothetical protein